MTSAAQSRTLLALPHRERLTARVESEDAPIVLFWGLPGSGRRRLLQLLTATSTGALSALTARQGSSAARLEEALALGRRGGAAGWVCEGWSPLAVGALLEQIELGERVLASVDRLPAAAAEDSARVAVVGPGEWLLERSEVVRCAGAERRPAEALDALFSLTGGWLRPLEIAIAAGLDPEIGPLLDDERMRRFLGDRVLASLSEEERRRLERGSLVVGVDRLSELSRRRRAPCELLAGLLERGRRAGASAAPMGRPSASFEARLLGSPEIRVFGQETPLEWPYRRVISILALLLLEPDRSIARDRVIGALWPDRPPDKARANLNPAVSHLRRWLARGDRTDAGSSAVQLVNGVYRLNPSWRWRVDVEEFEQLVADGAEPSASSASRLETLERARRLYRGPLLEGLRGRWLRERRRRLAARYRGVLQELGDLYAGLGRLADAEDSYRSLLAVEPLEEEVHVAIMRLYARQGREDLVRRQYEKLAALLARELGMHPMDETIREVQRLLGRE